MADNQTGSLAEKANAAFRQAASKVIERAKQTGTPVDRLGRRPCQRSPPRRIYRNDRSKTNDPGP